MLQPLLEHFGVAVSALSGVLAARGKRIDLFGVLVLAAVTAFGGGTLRDVALGSTPVFWIRDSSFLLTGVATAVAAFFAARVHEFEGRAFLIADAIALAMFTMIGSQKALAHGADDAVAVAMGVITGVAGGIFRDVLTSEIPLVFRPTIHLYATAALAGALVFTLLHTGWPEARWPLLAGAAVTLGLRLAAIRWKIGLPEFRLR
jgi:uncharacterized membrane protein YeiH